MAAVLCIRRARREPMAADASFALHAKLESRLRAKKAAEAKKPARVKPMKKALSSRVA